MADLSEEGDHGPVLSELASLERQRDQGLDELFAKALPKIPESQTKIGLLELIEKRPYEDALRAALEVVDDEDEDVRATALKVLYRAHAPRGERYRRDLARVLAKRIRQEKSARARKLLFQFCTGEHACGRYPTPDKAGKHTCSTPLLKALKSLAKSGDLTALRCLGAHPSDAAIQALLEVMSGGDDALKVAVRETLANLTGFTHMRPEPGAWKKAMKKRNKELKRRLSLKADGERVQLEIRNRRAEKRAKQIRGDS